MALLFAELDTNDTVIQVVLVAESDAPTESEGITFLKNLTGKDKWIQTFSDGTRGRQAGVGYIYDRARDVFYAPSPYESWILNTNTWMWEAPIAPPANSEDLWWDEPTRSWVKEYSTN